MGTFLRRLLAVAFIVASTTSAPAFAQNPFCGDELAGLVSASVASPPASAPATAADALTQARQNPQALLDYLRHRQGLGSLLDLKASAKGTETVGEHTLLVLKRFNELEPNFDFGAVDTDGVTSRLVDLLRATLALHDIGKGVAVEKGDLDKQHAFTLPILEKSLKASGFDAKEIALAKALVNNNLLGDLARGAISQDDAHAKLLALAKESGLEPHAMYRLLSAVWMADAGAHANLRPIAFNESNGRIDPKNHDVVALGQRVGVSELWKGESARAFAKADQRVRELNATPAGKELNAEDVFDVLTLAAGAYGRQSQFTEFHQQVSKLVTRLAQPENAPTREILKQYGLDLTQDALAGPLAQYDATTYGMFKAPNRLQGSKGALKEKEMKEKPDDFVVLYHGTTPAGAAAILKSGVDLTRGNGEFGRGFYLTSSPEQARDWVEGTKKEDAVLVRVVLRRSAVEAMREKGAVLDFPMPDARTEGTDPNKAFELFVQGNRMLRKQDKTSQELFEGVDMVSGPSVSARSRGTFDQFKFGGTARAKALFDSASPDMRLDVVSPP